MFYISKKIAGLSFLFLSWKCPLLGQGDIPISGRFRNGPPAKSSIQDKLAVHLTYTLHTSNIKRYNILFDEFHNENSLSLKSAINTDFSSCVHILHSNDSGFPSKQYFTSYIEIPVNPYPNYRFPLS